MRRDLRQPCPPPQWPHASRLLEFNPELAPAVHQLLNLGCGHFPDYPSWFSAFTHDAEFDPSLCFVVADDQGLIGVAQCWTSAFIRDLVIHPRARRQGLARALLHHAFTVFRLRGEACLDLKVLETNEPARRLYETSGMGYVQRLATN
ncbi:GNAT family N-acetyltransferase [Pseudomonas sp. NA-150]|uniref:GNAT family N-acetyltransferase n=1 Tax=Pseudomonas sp. NA-150 TaxID=3367525 RepID=UPI0037CC0E7D